MSFVQIYNAASYLKYVLTVSVMYIALGGYAQFAPAAGLPGSTAIPASSDSIVMWASGCTVVRGLQDIAVLTSGYATAGDSLQAIGPAGGNTIVSLGDKGMATLTFDHAIVDRPGFDFAIFENGFSPAGPEMAFLELAFVEVSSDGQRFVRFPSIDNTQDTLQIGNGNTMDARMLNNLAGKYVSGFGTPFDLDELRDSIGLDISRVTHIRIIDVIGTLDDHHASRDIHGHKINDPYPTPFASCGFDLDAVGVMHADGISGVSDVSLAGISIYPNPVVSKLYMQTYSKEISNVVLTDMEGREVISQIFSGATTLEISALHSGVFLANITSASGSFTHLIVKQ